MVQTRYALDQASVDSVNRSIAMLLKSLNDSLLHQAPTCQNQGDIFISQFSIGINFLVNYLRNQIFKVVEIQDSRPYFSSSHSLKNTLDNLALICLTYDCIHEELEKIFQYSTSAPILSQSEVRETQKSLQDVVELTCILRRMLAMDNELQRRRCMRVLNRHTLARAMQKYMKVVNKRRYRFIGIWALRVKRAYSAMKKLGPLEDCDHVLTILRGLLDCISTYIPRLDNLAPKQLGDLKTEDSVMVSTGDNSGALCEQIWPMRPVWQAPTIGACTRGY